MAKLLLSDVRGEVKGQAEISSQGIEKLELTLSSPQVLAEFRRLLSRGLNTWDDAPTWLFDLDSMVNSKNPQQTAGQ